MTIKPGEPWGREVERPADLVVVSSDAEAVRVALEDTGHPVGLSGGDLFTTLGAPGARTPVLAVEIDAIRVDLDGGGEHLAIAHVIARRSWWRGPLIAAMNVDRLGAWNVAPRAHPNDGVFDVVEVSSSMSIRDRWTARTRLSTGTHLPHPAIATRRCTEASWDFDRPIRVWIDGVEVGSTSALSLALVPDRFVVHA
jgi:YegS C-terminal NAD kinase beta sandwich-like domain